MLQQVYILVDATCILTRVIGFDRSYAYVAIFSIFCNTDPHVLVHTFKIRSSIFIRAFSIHIILGCIKQLSRIARVMRFALPSIRAATFRTFVLIRAAPPVLVRFASIYHIDY